MACVTEGASHIGEPIVGYYVCLEDTTGAGGAHGEAGGAAPDLADTISGLAVAVSTAVAKATEGERVASCTKGEKLEKYCKHNQKNCN